MPSIVSSSSKLKSNGYTNTSAPQATAMERQAYGGADGLVRGIVPHGKVRMVQCLLTRDALRGIEVEELAE